MISKDRGNLDHQNLDLNEFNQCNAKFMALCWKSIQTVRNTCFFHIKLVNDNSYLIIILTRFDMHGKYMKGSIDYLSKLIICIQILIREQLLIFLTEKLRQSQRESVRSKSPVVETPFANGLFRVLCSNTTQYHHIQNHGQTLE